MPIDPKVSIEKSIPTSFCQSNSFHSFNSKTSQNPNLVASKSSNCLTDGLIEDEELIDKLFPKCRPKSKTSSASSSKSDRTNGYVKKTVSSDQTRFTESEMLNVPTNHSSSAITNGETNGSNTCDEPRRSKRKSNHPQNLPLQSRRLWNFMDISPSPSPPPLSPVEDMPNINSHKYISDSGSNNEKLALYTPTQERPSPVGQYESACFDYDHRESFNIKGRFDINSLEVNRIVHEQSNDSVNLKANQPDNVFSAKNGYYNLNDGSENIMRPQTNHRHAGAHFRLDSLLLSPDEQRESYKVTKLPNGIKKSNRFMLECDLNDEDDVLFSRINTIASTTGNGFQMKIPPNPAKSECINALPTVDKPRDRPFETFVTSEKREHSADSVKIKPKLHEENENEHMTKVNRNNINIKGDSLSDNEEDEVERNSGTLNRNRIEIAGGKELFSSSRSTRAKRRSTNQMKFGPSEQRRDSVLSRHTQLYSVSMAADSEQVWDSATSSAATNKLVDEESSQTVAREADKPQQTQTQPIVTLASDSQAATGNDCNLVRAQITSSLSTDSNQHPAQNLNDTKLISSKDSTLTDLCSRHQTFFDVNETKESEPRQCVSVVHENLAHSLDKYTLHKTQVNQASGLDTLSSRRKSTMTMTFEDENNSPKMSFRDNVANKNELMSCNFFDDSLQGTKCAELKLEESFHNATQAKDIRPLNKQDQESDLCNQMQQSVNLSCDQFAQDLKMKLDIVSNCGGSNYADTQCDNENKVSELDSDSVKSASLSQKSFEGNDRIARVIGSVPIAQYEGSPKRYGPKPGYPKRVLSTSSNNSNDYETIPPKKVEPATDDIGHKSTVLSSENGSPHSSTSSTSSATFSSTDIHSSSSFSCPSNQKSNGFSNWNIQSRVKDHFDTPLNGFSEHRKSSYEENTLNAKTESNSMHQVTCDEIVKTILSLPSGPIDTEDDIDEVTSSSDKPIDSFSNDNLPGCEPNRLPNEPIYSSITGSGYSADANKSSGYSSKRSLHSDDSESVTKSKTSISSNGCDRNITRSTTSIKTQQSDIPVRGQKELNKMSSSQFANEQRNIPKSFRTDHYSRHLEESQSFESTDSSYRSDKYPSKDYYDQSDEDGYMFGQNYPIKQVSLNGSRLNGNSNDGRNLLEPMPSSQITQLNYTCLSPELSSQDLKSQAKLYTESAYESAGYPSDQCDAYSDNMTNDKTASGCVPGVRISTMPVLEDGLSSGMPSSDEMEYDEDEDGEDDLMTHEHDDLDDYVDEYNRRTGPCDSILPSQFPVNGPNTNSTNYGFHYKQQTQNDYNRTNKIGGQSQPLYRCATKTGTSFGLELSEDLSHQTSIDKKDSLDYFNGHHHHLNHHVHNHPVLDDNSRANLSSYENGKHSTNTPGQDVSYNHDKFCISSQLRSVSNSSSNNSSMSTVRNATCQLGPSGPKQQSTSPPPPNPSHHHYHHYYHSHHPGSSLQQPITNRQNYPNLSSSPTSLSPNSPGGMHHQSSASSSSSSSHPASSAPHHYHQQQAHPSQTSSQPQEMVATNSPSSSLGGVTAPNVRHHHDEDCDTDQETDRLLGSQRNDDRGFYDDKVRVHAFESAQLKRSSTSREAFPPKVLIEGVLFRARYLGSTQLVCDGQPTKATRMMQAEEAVSRIKAPEGETQPSTEVDLFISTEKIMVLNTDLKEIMMDHALRTISYIADIGDLLVLMARRRTPIDDPNDSGIKRIPKMICHVFESEEAQYIAQSIGQAFQVAYMEFLKANGIEDSSFLKEMDYQEVLNSQEIFGNELEMFAKREKQKEVIVPKQKGEILGIVIVESGWGSMLPTVVIANMAQSSPSARCGQLNIGDQIIAINGISLVGLPLSTCQAYVKNTKNQTAVKFTIVPCAPVVEVKIKRPDTKYQLGFSVQNGVICSLLRGGIAERGGVRVGHRIIEINGQSVVAVPHDRIVNLLATSVGEIHMKTMPTSMFRLLTGQDSPSYM